MVNIVRCIEKRILNRLESSQLPPVNLLAAAVLSLVLVITSLCSAVYARYLTLFFMRDT